MPGSGTGISKPWPTWRMSAAGRYAMVAGAAARFGQQRARFLRHLSA
jgi:hypothetical protein